MKLVTVAEIIVALLIAVGIITWLVRRNVKDERNASPELTDGIKDETPDEVHKEGFKNRRTNPASPLPTRMNKSFSRFRGYALTSSHILSNGDVIPKRFKDYLYN